MASFTFRRSWFSMVRLTMITMMLTMTTTTTTFRSSSDAVIFASAADPAAAAPSDAAPSDAAPTLEDTETVHFEDTDRIKDKNGHARKNTIDGKENTAAAAVAAALINEEKNAARAETLENAGTGTTSNGNKKKKITRNDRRQLSSLSSVPSLQRELEQQQYDDDGISKRKLTTVEPTFPSPSADVSSLTPDGMSRVVVTFKTSDQQTAPATRSAGNDDTSTDNYGPSDFLRDNNYNPEVRNNHDTNNDNVGGSASHGVRAQASSSSSSATQYTISDVVRYRRVAETMAMTMPTDQVPLLAQETYIAKIEDDTIVYLHGHPHVHSTKASTPKARHDSRPQAQREQESLLRNRTNLHATFPTHAPAFATIQEEGRALLFDSEVLPVGIVAVQGASSEIPLSPYVTDTSTPLTIDDDECFRVCVIDSGLMITHDDFGYNFFDPENPTNLPPPSPGQTYIKNIAGSEFGLPKELRWYNPSAASSHGTHVTGTIVALGGNDIGVVGVLPDEPAISGICLLIARVFDDTGKTSGSNIIAAVEWCGDNKSRVINMSLGGGGTPSDETKKIYKNLYEKENVLIVAATGNLGNSDYSYPASLEHVMSVAAVDARTDKYEIAAFSQTNDEVDIAGPGVNVLSTAVVINSTLNVPPTDTSDASSTLIRTALMRNSPLIVSSNEDEYQQIEYVDCQLGFEECSDARDKICIISRGDTTFWEKATNCEDGGGIAAIIYNNDLENVDAVISGTLGDNDSNGVKIPVLGTSRRTGELILQALSDYNDDINENNGSSDPPTISLSSGGVGYASFSGTSMAAPHVTGAAAKIWSARPDCTNEQIREALEGSALDLGDNGRDDAYGHGLVQTVDAYNYLLENFEYPCGDINAPTSSPTPIASSEPSAISQFNDDCSGEREQCMSDADCCTTIAVQPLDEGSLSTSSVSNTNVISVTMTCNWVRLSEPKQCRRLPKASKAKLSSGLGGAGGGNRFRNLRQKGTVPSKQRGQGRQSSQQKSKDQRGRHRGRRIRGTTR